MAPRGRPPKYPRDDPPPAKSAEAERAAYLGSPEYILQAEERERAKRQATHEAQSREEEERRERAAERNRMWAERQARERAEAARRMDAENAEQAELLAAILSGSITPHEIDHKLLRGDKAKATLLQARNIWDVLFQFRLDGLAHDALEFLGETMRNTEVDHKVRVDAAKTLLGARAKMANKVNNPGEAAVRALLGGMGQRGQVVDLRSMDDGELFAGFKRILAAAVNAGD